MLEIPARMPIKIPVAGTYYRAVRIGGFSWKSTQKQWQVTYLLAVTYIIMLVFSTKIVTSSAPCWRFLQNWWQLHHVGLSLVPIKAKAPLFIGHYIMMHVRISTNSYHWKEFIYQASIWTDTTSRHVMSQPRNESLHTNRIHASWSTWITTY